MDKQGRITKISEVEVLGEYRWKKGNTIDEDKIIVLEKPSLFQPYIVAEVNGYRINLWHWRGRLLPWNNKQIKT
jgi:hypothetical protein